MKYLLSFLCCFLLASHYSAAQVDKIVSYEYVILYDYTFQPSKTDTTYRVSEQMYLETGQEHSYFLSYNLYRKDSLLAELALLAEQTSIASLPPPDQRPPQAKLQYKLFKELAGSEFYFSTLLGVHTAHYRDTLTTPNWQLHDDEKVVAGYLCKKATAAFAGRDYIAWYAPAIALKDGPYKFNGLPGLILSVYDTEQQHVFTASSIKRQDQHIALKKWQGRFVTSFATQEAFTAYVDKMKANPALMYEQDLIKVPDELLQQVAGKLKESIDRYNNPIERTKEMP